MKEKLRLVEVSSAQILTEMDLGVGDEVKIMIEGEVTSTRRESNHDGTYNLIFRIKGRRANKS